MESFSLFFEKDNMFNESDWSLSHLYEQIFA